MIDDLIRRNRSFRRFDESVRWSRQDLEELVELARCSPSAANLQPLKFFLAWEEENTSRIYPCLRWAAYLQDWGGPETPLVWRFDADDVWVAPDGVEYMGYAVRTDGYRYVEWMRWDDKSLAARELYDHRADPSENANVAGDPAYAAALEEMAAVLKTGWMGALPPGGE